MPIPEDTVDFIEEYYGEIWADRISAADDLCAVDKDGFPILFIKPLKNSAAAIEKLLELGVPFYVQNKNNFTPLHRAVINKDADAVKSFLNAELPEDQITKTDVDEMNPLHHAAEDNAISIIKILLKDKRFKALIEARDLYGAIDFAIQNGSHAAIRLLLNRPEMPDEEIRKLPGYKKELFINTSQNKLNSLMKKYIDLQVKRSPRKIKVKINSEDIEEGQCNGWSFLWGHYASLNQEPKFQAIKEALALWDGRESGLHKAILPDILLRKYRYDSQATLLNQFKKREAWFKILWQKANDNNPQNQIVKNFFKTLQDYDSKNSKYEHELERQIQFLENRLKISQLNTRKKKQVIFDLLNKPATKSKQSEKQNDAIKIQSLYRKHQQAVRNSKEKLWKMLTEVYAEYQKLSPSEQQNYPFKEICIDLEKYDDLEDLYTEIISAIIILQADSSIIQESLPQLFQDQAKRVEQFQIIGKRKIIPTLDQSYNGKIINYNAEQLIEMVMFYSQFRGLYIDIGSNDHAVGCYITPKGQLKYHDSNWDADANYLIKEKRNIFDSPEAVVKNMIKYVYNLLEVFDEYPAEFFSWQFENSQIEKIDLALPQPSPNGFTSLHLAIMTYGVTASEQHRKAIFDTFNQEPLCLFSPDNHDRLPLNLLIMMGEVEMLSSLIDKVDISEISDYPLETGASLFKIALTDKFPPDVTIAILNKFKIGSNKIDPLTKETALMFAIKHQAPIELIEVLMAQSDLSAVDSKGRTAWDYAKDSHRKAYINLFVQLTERDKLLTESDIRMQSYIPYQPRFRDPFKKHPQPFKLQPGKKPKTKK